MMADRPRAGRRRARAAAAGGRRRADAIARGRGAAHRGARPLDDPTLAARAADLRADRAPRRRPRATATASNRRPARSSSPTTSGPARSRPGPGQIAGIVLAGGGTTAHAAIVARSLGIPLVTGAGEPALADPRRRADRASTPTAASCCATARRRHPRCSSAARIERAPQRGRARDSGERHEPAVTTDGRAVRLLANAGTRGRGRRRARGRRRRHRAAAQRAGVPRRDRAGRPRRSTRRRSRRCSRRSPNRIATVRTLDFGGDKTPPFLAEHGRRRACSAARGIRLALARPSGVAPQLRALLRVAGDAVLRILVPMVTEAGRGRRRARDRARRRATPSPPARPTRWSGR